MGTDDLGLAIAEALQATRCTVFPGAGRRWRTPNSKVMSVPSLPMAAFACVCDVRNATTSIVRVSGTTPESLHYHTSHVIGLAVGGVGLLRTVSAAGSEESRPIESGDIVVIPKGALHVFESPESGSMEYIAFEFSDGALDYQAHWLGS